MDKLEFEGRTRLVREPPPPTKCDFGHALIGYGKICSTGRGMVTSTVYCSSLASPFDAEFAKLIELLDAHNVSFISITQSFNTTTSMGA
jgi:hypothetical protein